MKLLRPALIGLTLVLASPLSAQVPPIPSMTIQTVPLPVMIPPLNTLIGEINAILGPLIPAPAGAVNFIALTPGVTGTGATIGLAPGADANAGITIDPNGSGNIVLFSSEDTGTLQFGNTTAFVRADGLVPCPGVTKKGAPFGVGSIVSGYLVVKDWTGARHGIPACKAA